MGYENLGFTLTGASSHYDFSVVMAAAVPDMHLLDTGQFFPRYRYEAPAEGLGSLFEPTDRHIHAVDNITDSILCPDYQSEFGAAVTKDGIFNFVYGVLHSAEYRTRYGADLNRMLPRIPKVKHFYAFQAWTATC